MGARPLDDKPSDTLVVVPGYGFWTGSSTLPHLHQHSLAADQPGVVAVAPASALSARAISFAQAAIASHGRKSPSGALTTAAIARSPRPRSRLSSRPAITRWPWAPVSVMTFAASTGSVSGTGGSPSGPLENSQTGRRRSASDSRSASSTALPIQRPA